MRRFRRLALLPVPVLLLAAASLLAANPVEHTEKILKLDAEWERDTGHLRLIWEAKNALKAGVVTIDRRPYGATGAHTWQPIATDLRRRRVYTDNTVEPGKAYEYRVIRTDKEHIEIGYWLAGREVPAPIHRGVVVLVIDDTVVEPLSTKLDRFEADLVGDGWRVIRHLVPRHNRKDPIANLAMARDLRAWVANQVEQTPNTLHSLILLGHVPVVKSGSAGPDGHGAQRHETDLFYADIGMRWAEAPKGELWPSQIPDLRIDMNVGRIDFQPVAGNGQDHEAELAHLAHYLDKNHAWRHGELGDLRTAYGNNSHLFVEQAMLRNIVGPDAIAQGGHLEAGTAQPHLWGVDFGPWDSKKYPGAGIKPVFAINFGSGKQHFAKHNSTMTHLLAQPDYPLAVGWGARPAWWLQHMALGGSIGDVHRRTVNNGPWRAGPYQQALDYYPMGVYNAWRGPIWVNLLGDPTLSAFPLKPPAALTATITTTGVELSWQASKDVDTRGYQVFRADSPDGSFEPVSDIITETRFVDREASAASRYMVRAYGLKTVHAGSFYRYSQGVFIGHPSASP